MYSKLVSWEVWNFESIAHGKCEFDEKNIINIKGFNDSGKSAMILALKVLLVNANPQKQVDFIQDDKTYFRILATFDDGVQVLRDKYVNGQSLYEMYKDGDCIFTTKTEGGALTRVSAVPEPVADYLGLIVYDTDCINIRTRHDELLGVDTGGSKNYKMFNKVLMSEEIAVASGLINNDRNKMSADISAIEVQVSANKELLGSGRFLTETMLNALKCRDSVLDGLEGRESIVIEMQGVDTSLQAIRDYPELPVVDAGRLNMLAQVRDALDGLDGVVLYPELPSIDSARIDTLIGIAGAMDELSGMEVPPEVVTVEFGSIELLSEMARVLDDIAVLDNAVSDLDSRIESLPEQMDAVMQEVKNSGLEGLVKCPDCGHIFHGADCALY